jgi:hypothetical protein
MGLKQEALGSIDEIRNEVAELNNRGVELAKQSKLAEAIQLFEETSERMPGNRVVNLNTALVLLLDAENRPFTKEDSSRIERYLQRVEAIEPGNRTLKKLQQRFQALHTSAKVEA